MGVVVYPQNIVHNYKLLQQSVNGELVAVIKSDGYGHGLITVYEALKEHCHIFAVASVSEGLQLRANGAAKRLVVLSDCLTQDDFKVAKENNLEPVLHCMAQFVALQVVALPRIWLKFDSGMHRAGLNAEECGNIVRWCNSNGVEIAALMSHLQAAEDADADAFSEQQRISSEALANELSLPVSLANSAACIRFGNRWQHRYFRAGISLYGMSPLANKTGAELNLKPAMRVTSTIASVRTIRKGEGVGYNHIWRADKDCQVGLIVMGYGDGYPRMASGDSELAKARVFLCQQGCSAAVIGRVSMDMITVDLSGIAARAGDEVELWGSNAPLEHLAAAVNSISYEILTHSPLARRRGWKIG